MLCGIFSKASAQQHPIPEVHRLMVTGIDQVIVQNYTGAYKTFTELDKSFPAIPLGKILLAANQISKEYELNLPFSESQIIRWLDAADQQADQLLKTDENNVWYNYYKGMAKGYLAYYYGLQESWVKAFSTALSAKGSFEKCLEQDPGFTESYIAMGAYKYWKSEKTEFLSWIIKDERAEGIKLLQSAIVKHSYESFLAVHNLFWIYIHKKEYKNAYNVILPAFKKYPASRFFKWDFARVLEEMDRGRAISLYNELLAVYRSDHQANRCNEITLLFLLAKNYLALGDNEHAKEFISQIPAKASITAHEREKLGKRLERIEELRTAIH